jgi:hypothetical protein
LLSRVFYCALGLAFHNNIMRDEVCAVDSLVMVKRMGFVTGQVEKGKILDRNLMSFGVLFADKWKF